MIFGLCTLVLKNNLLYGDLLMLGFFFFLCLGNLVKGLWYLILRVDRRVCDFLGLRFLHIKDYWLRLYGGVRVKNLLLLMSISLTFLTYNKIRRIRLSLDGLLDDLRDLFLLWLLLSLGFLVVLLDIGVIREEIVMMHV